MLTETNQRMAESAMTAFRTLWPRRHIKGCLDGPTFAAINRVILRSQVQVIRDNTLPSYNGDRSHCYQEIENRVYDRQ